MRENWGITKKSVLKFTQLAGDEDKTMSKAIWFQSLPSLGLANKSHLYHAWWRYMFPLKFTGYPVQLSFLKKILLKTLNLSVVIISQYLWKTVNLVMQGRKKFLLHCSGPWVGLTLNWQISRIKSIYIYIYVKFYLTQVKKKWRP